VQAATCCVCARVHENEGLRTRGGQRRADWWTGGRWNCSYIPRVTKCNGLGHMYIYVGLSSEIRSLRSFQLTEACNRIDRYYFSYLAPETEPMCENFGFGLFGLVFGIFGSVFGFWLIMPSPTRDTL
jgi:hypothetical protein